MILKVSYFEQTQTVEGALIMEDASKWKPCLEEIQGETIGIVRDFAFDFDCRM